MLISPQYVEQNKLLHKTGNYGISGAKWADAVSSLCEQLSITDVLDYGCGSGTLKAALSATTVLDVKEYDPAIEGKDATPLAADLVVCGDVLEHIEPDCLDNVLDDLRRVTKRVGLFIISTMPAHKVLPDGRNAHLIVQTYRWWLPRIWKRFEIVQLNVVKKEFSVVVK